MISKLDNDLVNGVMKAFVKKCKERHAIAFMQWRIFYSPSKTTSKKMNRIIKDRLKMMESGFKLRS